MVLVTALLCWPITRSPVLETAPDRAWTPPSAAHMFAARQGGSPGSRPLPWRYQPLSLEQLTTALIATGSPPDRARAVAPLVRHWAKRRDVSPLLVTSVLAIENAPLNPTATSSAGARGLMQVMPLHWRPTHPCGGPLTAASTNLCLGTAILAEGLSNAFTLRGALLRYNGCRRTPGCERYASHVAQAYTRQHAALTTTRGDANPMVANR